jgi:hypothetical protein
MQLTTFIQVPQGRQAPRIARHQVRRALLDHGITDETYLALAELIATELVTNAVRHAGGTSGVQVLVCGPSVVFGVCDSSAALPRRRPPDTDGGRGLTLIEGCADRWGMQIYGGGKTIWAQLTLPDSAPRTASGQLRAEQAALVFLAGLTTEQDGDVAVDVVAEQVCDLAQTVEEQGSMLTAMTSIAAELVQQVADATEQRPSQVLDALGYHEHSDRPQNEERQPNEM